VSLSNDGKKKTVDVDHEIGSGRQGLENRRAACCCDYEWAIGGATMSRDCEVGEGGCGPRAERSILFCTK